MILAAGLGTRMGALTANTPKPLLKVAGKTLIEHTLDHCAAAGVERAVVNLHYLGNQIRTAISDRRAPEIVFSEETEILETGGGTARALPLLGDNPFYSLNSDSIWTGAPPLATLTAGWRAGAGALLHLVRRDRAIGYSRAGDFFMAEDGRLTRRGEASAAPLVFTGAQIIAPGSFEGAPQGAFSTNLIWDRLIAKGRLFGVVHDGGWVDVGTPEGLRLAEEALSR